MDGAYVAVKFPGTSSNTNCQSNSGSDADPSSLLQDCRLLRIDELQVSMKESPTHQLNVGTLSILQILEQNSFLCHTGCQNWWNTKSS